MEQAKYPNQVVINKHHPLVLWRQSVVILVGASGSGKSTFAHRHFPATMVVSTDYCRALICDSPANQRVSDDAFELFYFIIAKRLKNGLAVVADSTALQRKYRQRLKELATQYDYATTLILFDVPEEFCRENDENRRFVVGEAVRANQWQHLAKTREQLTEEEYGQLLVLHNKQEIDAFGYRWSAPQVECVFRDGLDIIGDVHGCYRQLLALLDKLGYQKIDGVYRHPQGRRAVFLGDIMDRGVENLAVFTLVYAMWEAQSAFYIVGNHCNKLFRWLNGHRIQITHGLDTTIAEIEQLPDKERLTFTTNFCRLYRQSYPYLIFDDGRLVVAHAGILPRYLGRLDKKAWICCLHGPQTIGDSKIGDNWPDQLNDHPLIVYGHIPMAKAQWRNQTINIDLGAGHGGALCGLRYPERELLIIPGTSSPC